MKPRMHKSLIKKMKPYEHFSKKNENILNFKKKKVTCMY